jgi:alpha-1,3-rhamnosyltransferase
MEKISVIIPSYNHEGFLSQAIESVVSQDYEGHIEVIVVDDASTDGSSEALKAYEHFRRPSREVRIVIKKKNKGINDSIETGLELSSGGFVQILASDDVLCQGKLSLQAKILSQSSYDAIYSGAYLLKEDGGVEEVVLKEFQNALQQRSGWHFVSTRDWGCPLTQSALFRRGALLDLMNIRRRFRSDDWAMLIALTGRNCVTYVDQPVFLYRQHKSNTYKRYNYTLPMRMDVALNLVEPRWMGEAISNILCSHADYLYVDGRFGEAWRVLACSLIFKTTRFNLKLCMRLLGADWLFNHVRRGSQRLFRC